MAQLERDPLRVLIADEGLERIETARRVVTALGHEVVAFSRVVTEVAALTRRERPDVAIVMLGRDTSHALELIGQIVQESACPVIVVLPGDDQDFVAEAARRGVFAYLVEGDPAALHGALEIALRRYAEYHNLEGAFARRAITERAKGILMERHRISEQEAFSLLRDHARRSGRKLIDIAEGVLSSHLLLPSADERRTADGRRQADVEVPADG